MIVGVNEQKWTIEIHLGNSFVFFARDHPQVPHIRHTEDVRAYVCDIDGIVNITGTSS